MLKKGLITSLLIFMSSCQVIPAPETIGAGVVLIQETTSDITIEKDKSFAIKLESNATTGYKWELARIADETVTKLEKSDYTAPGGPIPGAGGFELWQFKALKQGETTIKLIYIRSTGSDITPQREKDFKVTVY